MTSHSSGQSTGVANKKQQHHFTHGHSITAGLASFTWLVKNLARIALS